MVLGGSGITAINADTTCIHAHTHTCTHAHTVPHHCNTHQQHYTHTFHWIVTFSVQHVCMWDCSNSCKEQQMVIHIHNTYYVYGVHTNTVIGDFCTSNKNPWIVFQVFTLCWAGVSCSVSYSISTRALAVRLTGSLTSGLSTSCSSSSSSSLSSSKSLVTQKGVSTLSKNHNLCDTQHTQSAINLILFWTTKHTLKTLDNSMQRFAHCSLV